MKRLLWVAAALAVAVLAVFMVRGNPQTVITVRNGGAGPVTQLRLSVTGADGDLSVGELAPRQSRDFVPKFGSDASMSITWTDGAQHCAWQGGYVESTGFRTVLELRGCHDVHDTTTTHLWPWQ